MRYLFSFFFLFQCFLALVFAAVVSAPEDVDNMLLFAIGSALAAALFAWLSDVDPPPDRRRDHGSHYHNR